MLFFIYLFFFLKKTANVPTMLKLSLGKASRLQHEGCPCMQKTDTVYAVVMCQDTSRLVQENEWDFQKAGVIFWSS